MNGGAERIIEKMTDDFEKHEEKTGESFMFFLLCEPALFFTELESIIYIKDQGGMFLSAARWKEVRRKINEFYKTFPAPDIDDYNESLPGRQRAYSAKRSVGKVKQKKGYVYLMQHDGVYKIGISTDVPTRQKQINTALPHEVTVVHYFATSNMGDEEQFAHRFFAEKRLGGEWFELSADDVELFKSETWRE